MEKRMKMMIAKLNNQIVVTITVLVVSINNNFNKYNSYKKNNNHNNNLCKKQINQETYKIINNYNNFNSRQNNIIIPMISLKKKEQLIQNNEIFKKFFIF